MQHQNLYWDAVDIVLVTEKIRTVCRNSWDAYLCAKTSKCCNITICNTRAKLISYAKNCSPLCISTFTDGYGSVKQPVNEGKWSSGQHCNNFCQQRKADILRQAISGNPLQTCRQQPKEGFRLFGFCQFCFPEFHDQRAKKFNGI